MVQHRLFTDAGPVDSPFYRQQKNLLTVFAEGTMKSQPDTAIVTLGTQTESANVSTAQVQNGMITTKIIQTLIQLGIAQTDIQTADYRIDVLYDYENGKQLLRGYRVTHLLQVTVKQLDKVGEIIDTTVQNGANIVSNVQFALIQQEAVYNEALSLALKHAQQKARKITNTLKVTLNESPIKVTETRQTPPPVPYETALFAKSEAATPIMPGQLEITAHITAQFEYFY